MSQTKHILTRVSKVKKTFSTITLIAFALSHFVPAVTLARSSDKEILTNPAMIGVMMAVANLNHSMRVAAENPHDEWRVQNVRHAMGIVPVALMGLAAEFKRNMFVDNDLPTVLGMLGGFVDKNAADGYKKFLQNPSASAIPKLGANFPQSYIAKAEAEANQANSGKEDTDGQTFKNESKAGSSSSPSSDLKQFKNDDLLDLGSFVAQQKLNSDKASQPVSQNSQPEKQLPEKQMVDSVSGAEPGGRGIASATDPKSNFAPTMLTPRDLDSENGEGKDLNKSNDKKEDDGFFKKIGESKEQKLKANKKRKKLRDGISFFPSTIRFFPALALMSGLMSNNAFAVPTAAPEADKKEAAKGQPVQEGEQRTSGGCGAAGGGGGGGGDSQGGGGGEFLQGLAAIIAAAAPIAAVAIQADADKKIAQIQAQSQKELTQISAENAKYLSDQQKEITLTQTKVAQEVAEKNNQYATDRLERQLAELRTQRDQNYALEKEKRAIENDYNNKRIELANKQADQQVALNKEQLQTEIAKAGLSQGFGSKNNIPGSQKLSLTSSTGTSTQTYSAGTKAATGTAANQGSFNGPQLGGSLAASTANAGSAGSSVSSTGFTKNVSRGLASQGSAGGSHSGIPSLSGGTAYSGTEQSVTALNGAMQTVSAKSTALYRGILGKRNISGTSKNDINFARRSGKILMLSTASISLESAKGFLGTGRALAPVNGSRGITRPITRHNAYDGSVETGDNGGEVVGHKKAITFSFSQ